MAEDERLDNLQEFSTLIMQWARRAEERMNEFREGTNEFRENMNELSAAQAHSEAKIAALADAQIRTEGVVSALGEQMKELAVAQAHTDQRLDALIDIARGMHRGEPPQQS
jgi:peptidoglycan hydrolase CwlO-like protein